jgi:hypothetical protein
MKLIIKHFPNYKINFDTIETNLKNKWEHIKNIELQITCTFLTTGAYGYAFNNWDIEVRSKLKNSSYTLSGYHLPIFKKGRFIENQISECIRKYLDKCIFEPFAQTVKKGS